MTRQNKIGLANLIIGLMYQHHIYEWMSLSETKGESIHKWVMFGHDPKYKTVLQEMEKKKIIEFRSDKNGQFAAFKDFLGYDNDNDSHIIPTNERSLINGKVSKGFVLQRIEMELEKKIRKYKEIVP